MAGTSLRNIQRRNLSQMLSPTEDFRLGIDVQPWFYHSECSVGGESPRLRLLFYRCKLLLAYPIHPLFIFDRQPRRHQQNHILTEELTTAFIPIIEAFGFEWRYAPGDLLAELAHLNREGIIDAVLTDDVASMGLRCMDCLEEPVLLASKSQIYRKADNVQGVPLRQAKTSWCDVPTACRLATTPLANELYKAAAADIGQLQEFLPDWLAQLREESKLVPPGDIPELSLYITPEVSTTPEAYPATIKEPSLLKLAGLCESLFEWGWPEEILVRFYRWLWGPCPDDEVLNLFEGNGQLLEEVVGERGQDEDGTKEYRLQNDRGWVEKDKDAGGRELTLENGEEESYSGNTDEHEHTPEHQSGSSQKEKTRLNPRDPLRAWIPADLVDQNLVQHYKTNKKRKRDDQDSPNEKRRLSSPSKKKQVVQVKKMTIEQAKKEGLSSLLAFGFTSSSAGRLAAPEREYSPAKGFRLGIDVQPWDNHARTRELTEGFIHIIEAFGFEWKYAPGDPLAELACLNREGLIDAVPTDDVAVWMFGAQTVWRNPSSCHPKAKATVKETMYKVYDGITDVRRSETLMVLLYRGWCNAGSSLRLARTELAIEIYHAAITEPKLLPSWRSRLCLYVKDFRLVNCVPSEGFPLLSAYMQPSVSLHLVGVCPPRIFRFFGGGSEPGKVIDKIVGSRTHTFTDKTLEYRVEVNAQLLILWTKAGLKGTRQAPEVDVKVKGKEAISNGDDEDAEPTPDVDATSGGEDTSAVPSGKKKPLRIWIPVIMVQKANVELAKEYEKECEEKKARKLRRKRRGDDEASVTV
ncbi:hypothetical protein IW261DRAFT_1593859 [Armillaria novae-zelandiae]|uniref:XPG-I domain-containing protein n=1 Tax=Armillaria novae-zelandiae TaxID=153914 RepID=A0AA39UH79_9AGAR|nr:hypothetical protein IW261DRAFT_1593859 [Armillaria novae-zelandiae]